MIDAWTRRSVLGVAAAAGLLPGSVWAAGQRGAETIDVPTADGRACAVTVWRAPHRRGTILFSHGALSAPGKYTALILPWVAAGFDVWAPLHVDSTDHPDTKNYAGLASWPARIEDMRALAAHVGKGRYVAAGHSYGALVALTLGGAAPARPAGVSGPLADPRVAAAVAFSPPGPGIGLIDAAGYAALAVPAFIETGTTDLPPAAPGAPSSEPDAWRTHLAAYDATAPGDDRYALVLDGADHYFGNLICRPERAVAPQRAQLDLAVARSRAFLRGYGLGDGRARRTLAAMASVGPATAPGLFRR